MSEYGWGDAFNEILESATNPLNEVKTAYQQKETACHGEEGRTDVGVLGSLLTKAGLTAAATGLALEILPESAETVTRMTVASGLGAAAIGGIVTLYDRYLY